VTSSEVVRPFGRVRLTPFQYKVWLTFAGAVPGGVTTVDQLLQWVRARKADIALQEPEPCRADRLACMDALFEWSTGTEMPDAPTACARAPRASRSIGDLTCHEGDRIDLERELLALVMTGKGDLDRAREISAVLGRRGAPKAVR
jgi:hypothetical protein